MKKVTSNDIEKILGFHLNEFQKQKVNEYDLHYRDLTQDERDEYIKNFVDVLTKDIVVSGKHRLNQWESGWEENLLNFRESKNVDDLIPKYHGKNKIVKWLGEPILPLTENFDYKIHVCFVDAVLDHYSKNFENIFEFGCGPGYHLLRMAERNKKIKLNGCDWTKTSQQIIVEMNNKFGLEITPFNFDFFNPDYSVDFPEKTLVYTVAALEQVGENYVEFINFLLEKKPEICINFEPIDELLDETKIIDFLSIKYFRKRNYLNKFLPYLEELERQNKIEILKKQRIFSGSYFTEGHSLVVWKIKN